MSYAADERIDEFARALAEVIRRLKKEDEICQKDEQKPEQQEKNSHDTVR